MYKGRKVHQRMIASYCGSVANASKIGIEKIYIKDKHKYIYPLDKSLLPLCKSLSKPYPKNAELAHKGEHPAIQPEGAFDSTIPLNNSLKTGEKQANA